MIKYNHSFSLFSVKMTRKQCGGNFRGKQHQRSKRQSGGNVLKKVRNHRIWQGRDKTSHEHWLRIGFCNTKGTTQANAESNVQSIATLSARCQYRSNGSARSEQKS